MYAMSAAHKTLPLPCYARITNLDNGRSAVVRINDRGPFHSNRIIDLSYAAATKIGVFPKGTAMVEVRGIDPMQPDPDAELSRPGAAPTAPAVPRGTPRPDNTPFLAGSFADTTEPYQPNPYQPNEDAIARSLAIASRGAVPRQRFRSSPVDPLEPERAVVVAAAPMSVTAPAPALKSSLKTAEEDAPSAVAARGPDSGHEARSVEQGQGLYLQIGAFGDPRNAERLRERISPELAVQVRVQQSAEGVPGLYKVRIGPLASEVEARHLSTRLSALGVQETPRLIWN